MKNLKFGVIVVACVIMSGCGGKPISTPASSSGGPTYELAPSFWTEADYSMQATSTLYFHSDYTPTNLDDIERLGIENVPVSRKQTYFYDNSNRFKRIEEVVFPSGIRSISQLNSVLEYSYPSDNSNFADKINMKTFDSGSLTSSGRLIREQKYDYENFLFDLPMHSNSVFTDFNITDGSNSVAQTRMFEYERVYNDQGLATEYIIKDLAKGTEVVTTMTRGVDGRPVTESSTDGYLTSFEYDEHGTLKLITTSTTDRINFTRYRKLYFTEINGIKAVVSETEYREDSSTYYTEITFVEKKPCHPSTKNIIRWAWPGSSYCYDAGAWQ